MTAITVTNTDWAIVSAVRESLAGATIGGEVVFKSVVAVATKGYVRQCRMVGAHPKAVVIYEDTAETCGPGGERNCVVTMAIEMVSRAASDDESARLTEALRLKNAVMNAVEAAPPVDAVGIGSGDEYHEPLLFVECNIDTGQSSQPWVLCTLKLEVACSLAAGTSH